MPHRLFLLALLLVSPLAASAQPGDLRAHADIDSLTSRAFAGRGYTHDGARRAADFIVRRFRELGLDSLSAGYVQPFELTTNEFPATPRLVVDGHELRLGADYIPHEGCGSGSGEGVRVVDAGSGLVITIGGVNAYKYLVPQGAVVVFDEAVPDSLKRDKLIPRYLFGVQARIEFAQSFGARAVIILVDRPTFGKRDTAFGLPVFEVQRKAFPAGAATAGFDASSEIITTQTHNVVAMIPGTEVRDSTIVLCAHYDHLGMLGDSAWFPGANDNASGTALLLSLAAYLKVHPLRYSVLFLAFSGEEAGLLGSTHFLKHPLADVGRMRFLLNVDMTASGAEGIMAVGGVEFTPEFEWLRQAAHDAGLEEVRKRENAPNSDQYFFLRSGVRGFYVYPFTGLQPYHALADQPATLEWNVWDRMRRIAIGLLERIR